MAWRPKQGILGPPSPSPGYNQMDTQVSEGMDLPDMKVGRFISYLMGWQLTQWMNSMEMRNKSITTDLITGQ